MSTVAVIIPAYNQAVYIREAIESVLRQSRPADEVIVVDDGSTDNTADVAASYPGVTVIRQSNGGVCAARNHAVTSATSEWVAFLDHDDAWRWDKLQLQMAALDASPGWDVCICNAVALRSEGDPANFGPPPLHLPPSDQIAAELLGNLRFPPGTAVVRRDLLQRVGGFDTSAHPCEDWDLWLRLVSAGCRFIVVHEPLLLIRQHASNISNQSYRMMEAELRAWDKHIGPSLPAPVRAVRRLEAKSHFLSGVSLVEREQNRPHLGTMARSLLLLPVGDWHRHKVFAHMLLKRIGLRSAK